MSVEIATDRPMRERTTWSPEAVACLVEAGHQAGSVLQRMIEDSSDEGAIVALCMLAAALFVPAHDA